MAWQSKTNSRATRRRQEAALKLLALGAGLVILPLFLGTSPLGKGLLALIPGGLLLLAVGGLLLWLGRQAEAADRLAGPARAAIRQQPTQRDTEEPPPVDRTTLEFERAAEEARAARRERQAKPTAWGPAVFDVIEWRRFEAVVEALFQQAGLETKSQSHGVDGGVDVWLYSRQQPGQAVSLVQCKNWNGRQVGVDKIRELRGVMAARKVGRGVFATTSTFSAEAASFAQENGIDLLDVEKLLSIIAKRSPEQQQALLEVALEGEYWRPTCARCGVKMVEKTSSKDGKQFWSCAKFPICRTSLPMRAA